MSKNNNFEVRANLGDLSLDATNADGSLTFGNLIARGPSAEEQALTSIKIGAVAEALQRVAEREPVLADIYQRSLGLGDAHEETLTEIGRSLGMSPEMVRFRHKRAARLFERQIRLHPLVAFLHAA